MENLIKYLKKIKGELEITKIDNKVNNSGHVSLSIYYMLPYSDFEFMFTTKSTEPTKIIEELYTDIFFNGSSMEDHISQIKCSLRNELEKVGYKISY